MSDKWEELLRKKLENYEVEPPPGVWEGICEKMGIDPVTLEKKPAMSRWWWVAAAAVLALVGCFVVYEMSDSDQPLQADAMAQQQSSMLPSSEPVLAQQTSSLQQEDIASPSQTANNTHISSHRSQNKSLTSHLSPLTSNLSPLTSDLSPLTSEPQPASEEMVQQQEKSPEQHQEPSPEKPSEYEMFPDPVTTTVNETSASKAKWSVALKASGGLLATNNTMQTDIVYQSASAGSFSYEDKVYGEITETTAISSYYDYAKETYSTSYTVTEYAARHHLPLRLGLSLQHQLHPRLALLSGISYMRLSSEFSFPLYRNISYSQRLHYIGISLGMAWQLWQVNHFSFYCSGGAMVEKCVSVSLDGDYTGRKPWQFSVHAAAGAEYAFIPLLGVYIEPSLGYYFSDGTQLEHYYKEHPLAPSIEFGLRFHVGK